MVDITPLIPEGRNIITGYGSGGFYINDVRVEGSLLLLPSVQIPWDPILGEPLEYSEFMELQPLLDTIEILLFGGGKTAQFLSPKAEALFQEHGIVVDVMDTGAACRTYNVLLSEERNVAAALIAVP